MPSLLERHGNVTLCAPPMAATEATILADSTARAHAGVGPGATGPLRRQRACAAQHARFPSTTPRRMFLQGASPGDSSLVTGAQARPRIVHEAPACGCRSTSACAVRSAHPHEWPGRCLSSTLAHAGALSHPSQTQRMHAPCFAQITAMITHRVWHSCCLPLHACRLLVP